MKNVGGVFIVLCSGVGVAAVLATLEMFWTLWKTTSKEKVRDVSYRQDIIFCKVYLSPPTGKYGLLVCRIWVRATPDLGEAIGYPWPERNKYEGTPQAALPV